MEKEEKRVRKKPLFHVVPGDCFGVIIGFIHEYNTFSSFSRSSKVIQTLINEPVFYFPINVKFVVYSLHFPPKRNLLYVRKLGIDPDVKLMIQNHELRPYLKFFPRLGDIDLSNARLFTDMVFKDFDLKRIKRINITNIGKFTSQSITIMSNLEALVNDKETIHSTRHVNLYSEENPLPSSLRKIQTGLRSYFRDEAFKNLERLEDVDCYEYRVPEHIRRKLRRIVLWKNGGYPRKYETLDAYPFEQLTNLKCLEIQHLKFNIGASKSFTHLKNLEKLVLVEVKGLTGNGFKYLKKLKKLSIQFSSSKSVKTCSLEPENLLELKNLREFETNGYYTEFITSEVLRHLCSPSSPLRIIRLCCNENLIEKVRSSDYQLERILKKETCNSSECLIDHFYCEKCKKCPKCQKHMKCKASKGCCSKCEKNVCQDCIQDLCELCHRRFCKKCRKSHDIDDSVRQMHLIGEAALKHVCSFCSHESFVECVFCGDSRFIYFVEICNKCEKVLCRNRTPAYGRNDGLCRDCYVPPEDEDD